MTFRTYSIILSHILEQIPLNSQNSAEFAVKKIDVPFKYIQICSIIYLKKHKMRKRNLRLIFDTLCRFAEANAKVVLLGNGNQSNIRALPLQNLLKKSMLLLVALFIFNSVTLKAQSPQKINFQSIVRNTNGVIFSNKTLSIKISLLSGSITGTQVYSETHSSTTDAIGLVSLQIGSGTALSGSFATINWGNASHFIKLEADFNGGNNYVLLGTQELMSVPYAMYAAKTDTTSLNLTNRFAEKAPIKNPEFEGTVSGISKTMVGLGNVDNTSDASKPVSTATQTALNEKAPKNNPEFTGQVSGITKTMVGLGNVDNTSDASKPVSTATQTAIATKVNIPDTMTMLSKYLRKADFPSGSNVNEILYWNGSKWITLAPGTTGQVLTMSSDGLSWGCIITNTAATASSSPTLLVNTALPTPIKIATTGATGISGAGVSGANRLPNGVSAAWSANEITISGTPTEAGTFDYEIPLTGGCGTVYATGTITVNPPPACLTTTITYNGYNYSTVPIGSQCWMAENLRTRTYSDGTEIRFDNSGSANGYSSSWFGTGLEYGAYTIYANDSVGTQTTSSNLSIYGYLYNWYAAKGISTASGQIKNICPDGWHVPTDSDWNKLVKSIHSGADTTASTSTATQSTTAGGKMKSIGDNTASTGLWKSPNTGADDSSGFSALPGGSRNTVGSFNKIRDAAFFWSATQIGTFSGDNAWSRQLSYNDSSVTRNNSLRAIGGSIRCLKD
jgi:uncharacterized protein (TIGR02145 family)